MQSKIENRSTSGSEYFSKRILSSDSEQNYLLPSHISKLVTSNTTQQSSKIVSEYQIFQPSKLTNQPESSMNIKINEPSNNKQNPFLNTNYDRMYQNKQDKVYENNFSSNTFGRSHKQVRFENDGVYSSKRFKQSFTKTDRFKDSVDLRKSVANVRSLSSQKQNFTQFTRNRPESFKNPLNNTDLLQPITMIKDSTQKNALAQSMSESRFQNMSIMDEPHKILDHIYFSIAHESDFVKVFKTFAVQEQEKINQRFREMLMQLENTLSEIKIVFDHKIDHTYQTLLHQLNSLKQMAEIMWKNKRQKSNSQYKNSQISKLQKHQKSLCKNIERPNSKSKNYLKFSQSDFRSPETNNFLLNQIYEEDHKLNEYTKTKRFYDNKSEFDRDSIDRGKLLRDMFEVSKNITKMMKQCETIFFEEVFLENRERKKGFNWFNEVSISKEWYSPEINDRKYAQLQNISFIVKSQLTQLTDHVNAFRSDLKHKYLLS